MNCELIDMWRLFRAWKLVHRCGQLIKVFLDSLDLLVILDFLEV